MMALKTFFHKINLFENLRTVYLNPDGSILSFTDKQAQKGRIKREEVLGKNYGVLFREANQDKKFFDSLLDQADKRGRVSHQVSVKKDGKNLLTTINLESVKDENGDVIGFTVLQPKM